MREIIAHYKKTSCFVYIFFLIGYGALSLRFIWQTRKSIVGDTCDVSVPRDSSVKITPKIHANFASLNSSIAFGDLRLGGCLRGPQNSRGFCGLFWHTRIRGLYLRIYGSSSKLLTQGEFQSGRFWGWSCIMLRAPGVSTAAACTSFFERSIQLSTTGIFCRFFLKIQYY